MFEQTFKNLDNTMLQSEWDWTWIRTHVKITFLPWVEV